MAWVVRIESEVHSDPCSIHRKVAFKVLPSHHGILAAFGQFAHLINHMGLQFVDLDAVCGRQGSGCAGPRRPIFLMIVVM